MNDKPFQYLSHCGTTFRCERADLSTPIFVRNFTSTPNAIGYLMKDAAEMAGYHAVNIRPELNGFQGYDCLVFKFED